MTEQIRAALSPASAAKWESIRRRIQAHDARPTIIKPLTPMHRAILALAYQNACR